MTVRILIGDVRERLAELPDESVHCVVTSPPYLGLRDYGIEPVVWGGEAGCAHEWGDWAAKADEREQTKHGKTRTTDRCYGDESRRFDGNHQKHTAGQFCTHCNAWRGSLGLEPTPDLYVAHMVEVLREVRRVLRNDGTVWLNLGDSYASQPSGSFDKGQRGSGALQGGGFRANKSFSTVVGGLKPKDLMMMPARVALALQADGWWLRSDIIWSKPNPMPESVTDRPTSAHEHVFLLSKSARYYYDAEAVREGWVSDRDDMRSNGLRTGLSYVEQGSVADNSTPRKTKIPGGWDTADGAHGTIHREGRTEAEYQDAGVKPGRNLRNVWTVATAPFPEAHFATFPPALVEPCIKAGCPKGGTVLDPFGGAGTTGLVADRLQRDAILIEINPEYAAMARRRIETDSPIFAHVSA